MNKVEVLDKVFELTIPEEDILMAVKSVANRINSDLKGEEVVFVGILNGSFMFASDLYKNITLHSQISFLKLASYAGISTSGVVKELIGINEDIKNKTVVIVEDIIDTGNTLKTIIEQLEQYKPKQIKTATFLLKPEAYVGNIKIDYTGIEIPNDFIVGYGLDYNGYGRNLRNIYTLVK